MDNTAYFVIREPIWKDKSVGLAVDNVKEHNIVRITYKNKSGQEVYPHTYYVNGRVLMKKPVGTAGGKMVYLIPIAEMQIKL